MACAQTSEQKAVLDAVSALFSAVYDMRIPAVGGDTSVIPFRKQIDALADAWNRDNTGMLPDGDTQDKSLRQFLQELISTNEELIRIADKCMRLSIVARASAAIEAK